MDRREKGALGEKIARKYLERKNYRVLAVNYRVGRLGEVDLIASSQGTLCFVEVKTRTGETFGTPAEAVTKRKQTTIRQVAMCFLKEKGATDSQVRFDVMEVMLTREGRLKRINHLENVF